MPPASIKKSTTLDQRIADAGGPVPLTVLVLCGETMRRSRQPSSARPEETERALGALSVESAALALAGVDVTSAKTEVMRAISESFEAAFAEDDDERKLFASSAMTGLEARDRIASAIHAAKAKLLLAQQGGDPHLAKLDAAILSVEQASAELDRELRGRVRSLTGVNRERRVELEKLDPEERESAWWYSARSERGDDELLAALSGADGREVGAAAQADLAASALPSTDDSRVASTLRRVSHAVAAPAERAWLEARSKSDEALARATALASDASLDEAAEE